MIITVFNQKGGVAKTTTTANLAAALSEAGHDVAAVNLDPQRNLLRLDRALAGVEQRDASGEWPDGDKFASGLTGDGGLAHRFDFVLIDCPPSPQKCNLAALHVSNLALAPVQPGIFGVDGLGALQRMVARVRRGGNPDLMWRVLLTMHETGNPHHERAATEIRAALPVVTLPYSVKHSSQFEGAAQEGKSIFEYSPRSHGARAYRQLAQDMIALRLKLHENG